jgi:hypothetical protein
MLLYQRHQMMVDLRKGQCTDLDACFAKRLCRNNAQRIGAVAQMGKETIQFGLNGALQSGQQKSQNRREVKDAVTREEMWL